MQPQNGDNLSDEVRRLLPELVEIYALVSQSGGLLQLDILGYVDHHELKLPILAISCGDPAPNAAAITFVGGIHGIERIGTQVLLSYLHTLVIRAQWDRSFGHLLQQIKLHFIPLMNPIGMLRGTRANGNGVDLMRNSPIDANHNVPWLVGGQQLSRHLPWYRGDGQLEAENRYLIEFLKRECLQRPFNLVVDCHSGFGSKDRIWIPYAYRKRPPRNVANYFALAQLFDQTYPYHDYVFEPQSNHYTTHGDLWDHVAKIVKHQFGQPFLSLTLEMGSWRWVKKKPSQLLTFGGLFNPQSDHRWARVQRSHLILFEFLTQATHSFEHWLPNATNQPQLRKAAIEHWYRK